MKEKKEKIAKTKEIKPKKEKVVRKNKKSLFGKDTVEARVQKFKLEQKKKEKKSLKERIKNIDKRIWIGIIVIILIAVIFVIIVNLLEFLKANKYKLYEEKMDLYQFTQLYNNESCKSSESVTKAEAIRLAIATVFNTSDISGFAKDYDEYDGQIWVEYAKEFKIIDDDEITIDNYNEPVKYYEAVKYFENAKETFTEKEIKSTDEKILKNPETYDASVQVDFADMVANEIIVINKSNINARENVIKGQVNELVVNFLEKYALITLEGARLRFTDLPSNAEEYPYILFDVPNTVYEYESSEGMPIKEEMTSKELYMYKKENYVLVKEYVEKYYETMLNVDYETLNLISYTEAMDEYLIFDSLTTSVYEYFNYVKENKIKISADVTLVEPCVYFDGSSYRARIKIDLKILSADTRDNLLLYDNFYNDTYTYNQNEYTIYADACLTNAIGSDIMYLESQVVLGEIALNFEDLDITVKKYVDESEEVQDEK